MFRREAESEFHAAGPAIVNELSARRVLVRRVMKSPCADDRRRWSSQRLHRLAWYPGAVR